MKQAYGLGGETKPPLCTLLLASLLALSACSDKSSPEAEINDPATEDMLGDGMVHDRDIQKISDEFVQSHSLPGVVMAIAEVGQPLRIAASGLRQQGGPERITINDKMHLGSLTKAMTATLVARMVDRNQLRFDSTIAELMPTLVGDIHPQYETVTLEQLLSHQSGMPPNPDNWSLSSGDTVSEDRWGIARTALKEPPAFEPGSAYLYSNLGYMMAGLALEQVAGVTWEELVTREVFQPMELDSVGFGPPDVTGTGLQPWGHSPLSATDYLPKNADNPPALGPAGTVHMNVADWATFNLAHASNGTNLGNSDYLSQSSWETLHTPLRENYALGWLVVNRSWANGTTYTHSGSNTLWFATVWVAPNLNRAFLVATNAAGNDTAVHVDTAIGNLIGLD